MCFEEKRTKNDPRKRLGNSHAVNSILLFKLSLARGRLINSRATVTIISNSFSVSHELNYTMCANVIIRLYLTLTTSLLGRLFSVRTSYQIRRWFRSWFVIKYNHWGANKRVVNSWFKFTFHYNTNMQINVIKLFASYM